MESVRDSKGHFIAKHGGKGTKLYNKWCSMRERCSNPHNKRYNRYGGRGIKVCEEWQNFNSFKDWCLSNGYSPNLTIDRIDNDGNYEPSNCRFVTSAEQNRNYSRNHKITHNGKTLCITDWEKETGISRATLLWRIRNGKSEEEIFRVGDRRFKNNG